MKNPTLSSAAVLLMIFGAASKMNAQSDAVYASNIMHINRGGIDHNSSNERARLNFKEQFSSAEDAKWLRISDGFMSAFEQNNIKYRVGYNQHGDWQNTVRTYAGSNLPSEVMDMVDNVYTGYQVSMVEEITTRDKNVYIVHIENKHWMKQIKVDGYEINELEEFEIKK